MLSDTDRLFLSELIRGLPWVGGALILTATVGFWLRFECWPWEAML